MALSTSEQIAQLSNQISTLTSLLFKLYTERAELEKQQKKEQLKQEPETHKPTLSWNCFPQEVKENILDFQGLLEENKKKFSKEVLPRIVPEVYIREIKQIKKENLELIDFEFYHTLSYPGNFDVFYCGRHIINVHVDLYNIKHGWSSIMRWYDEEWLDMNEFIYFIIHHYVHRIPLPNRDQWFDF